MVRIARLDRRAFRDVRKWNERPIRWCLRFGPTTRLGADGALDGMPGKALKLASKVSAENYPRAADELSTSSARRLAAVRVSMPSFAKISRTCFFTVDSLLPRTIAISGLVLPCASHNNVSATRGVKP